MTWARLLANRVMHQSPAVQVRHLLPDEGIGAARLGYAPTAAARALRSGRSDIVLCLLTAASLAAHKGGLGSFAALGDSYSAGEMGADSPSPAQERTG